MAQKKALILYVFRYSGHYQAAKAIEKALHETFEGIEAEKINAAEYTNPILGKIVLKAYLKIIKKKPELWGDIYDNPDVIKKTARVRDYLQKFNKKKIKKLLESRDPDVVFCTQAFPCGMISGYKKDSGKDLTLICVLTDHAPHSYWIHDEVDLYVVPSEKSARMLEEKGVDPGKIRMIGIPIDPKFRTKHDPLEIKKKINIDRNDPTILIMGGNQGLGSMEDVVGTLVKDRRHNYQLIVVAGSNKKLYARLNNIKKDSGERKIQILSYVDNIDELMEASDIIISKPGGITIAEALAKELPMLIVNPIPGQERMNADYLVENGAAIELKDYGNIHDAINQIFDSEDVLEGMKANCRRLARPDSALDISKLGFGE